MFLLYIHMKETDLYNIDCNDIEDILAKNNENNVFIKDEKLSK